MDTRFCLFLHTRQLDDHEDYKWPSHEKQTFSKLDTIIVLQSSIPYFWHFFLILFPKTCSLSGTFRPTILAQSLSLFFFICKIATKKVIQQGCNSTNWPPDGRNCVQSTTCRFSCGCPPSASFSVRTSSRDVGIRSLPSRTAFKDSTR